MQTSASPSVHLRSYQFGSWAIFFGTSDLRDGNGREPVAAAPVLRPPRSLHFGLYLL